uniref:Uncharacterized protein n=1 Tax=Anopheles christyi TaxID=43041 RepID=A0A182KG79_9DIPT
MASSRDKYPGKLYNAMHSLLAAVTKPVLVTVLLPEDPFEDVSWEEGLRLWALEPICGNNNKVHNMPNVPVMIVAIYCAPVRDGNERAQSDWVEHKGSVVVGVASSNHSDSDSSARAQRSFAIHRRGRHGQAAGDLGVHERVFTKLTKQQQREVLAHIQQQKLPSDFKRRLCSLRYVQMWKASEYEKFLQVVGFVVHHFMLLFAAMTILSTSYHEQRWQHADELSHQFVAQYARVYRQEYVNSNVHNLLHVYEEVRRFGDLSTISAYPYEGKLYSVKQLVRSGRNSLAQAACRLVEQRRVDFALQAQLESSVVHTVRKVGRYKPNAPYAADSVFGIILDISVDNQMIVHGYQFTQQRSSFMWPYPAHELNIYTADMQNLINKILYKFPPATLCAR